LHHSEMRQFVSQFRELMYAMPFQLPQNLLLLGRTLAILSGMCTGLDPEFNLWEQLAPYARTLVAGDGSGNWNAILDQAGDLLRELLALPAQTSRVLTRIERGDLRVDTSDIARQINSLEVAVNRLLGGLIFAAFLSAGVLLYRGGDQPLGYVFWGLAALSLAWTALLARGRAR
jgi:predicted unusual protein kinase regulating ubiquinone biosynthesis (AarF/ABC1/UbiB family)